MPLPPSFPDVTFQSLATLKRSEIEVHFALIVDALQEHLNSAAPLNEVQRVRGQSRKQTFQRAARVSPGHWWFTHEGARSEAQWNIGMFPCHLRFGIGFEYSQAGYGNLQEVAGSFERFRDALRSRIKADSTFAERLNLEVEINDSTHGVCAHDVSYILDPAFQLDVSSPWLFVGRLLRGAADGVPIHPGCAGRCDAGTLSDSARLAAELRLVAEALWPLWLASRP